MSYFCGEITPMNNVPEHISLGLRKSEKLKSAKAIEALFTDGRFISYGHLILKYKVRATAEPIPLKMGVTVSRKKFKRSVDRNFVKRILRETYRQQKPRFLDLLSEGFPGADFMFIYNANTKPAYGQTFEEMAGILKKLAAKVRKHETI